MAEPLSQPTRPAPPLDPVEARREIRERADDVWVRSAGAIPVRGTRLHLKGPSGRVAVVEGCRTPFAKAGGDLSDMDVVDLAGIAAAELVARSAIDPQIIDLSIFGVVVPALHAPNLGREVVFRASLPMRIPGTTVSLACASSNRAITSGAEAILTGECEVVLAGGAESLSNVPIQFSKRAARAFMTASKGRSLGQKLSPFGRLRPRGSRARARRRSPSTPPACRWARRARRWPRRTRSRGAPRTRSRSCRTSARRRRWPTAASPSRSCRSSRRRATSSAVLADNGVRVDPSLDELAALKPVFDRRYGTLTAGNSSPLTDGGAAVLLMSEEQARKLRLEPLGYIRSYAFAALDPGSQLLQGPAYAAPLALDRAGLTLADMDLVEMHEAFAAQILSNLKAFASRKFARDELGRDEPVGEVDFERFNVTGGSIAIGHPFGATGARVTTQLLYELRRRDLRYGLVTVCAAGGVGFAMVVERA